MFSYEKKLQYPVKIATPNPKLAAIIISQYGGPDGELGASMRYLSQRYAMPYAETKGLLTDIGTSGSNWHTTPEPLISSGLAGLGFIPNSGDTEGSFWHILSSSITFSSSFLFISRRFSRTKTHFWGKRFRQTSTRLSL